MPKKYIDPKDNEETPKRGNSFFDYLRFGESYTSLILGIIVVIISTALLLSFVHNRNAGNVTSPKNDQAKNTAQISEQQIRDLTGVPTISPDPTKVKTTPVLSVKDTPVPTVKKEPTAKPTVKPTVKPTEAPKKVAQAKITVAPTKNQAKPTTAPKTETKTLTKGEYTIQHGDTLWSISEKEYKSGYNWVDIARANNLSNPGMINAGNKLKLPKVVAKTTTVVSQKTVQTADEQNNSTMAMNENNTNNNKISGDIYTIVHGDSLWTIAERAYGDGYKWVDIARANNLQNPSLIHSQNKLKIPRGK